MKQHIKTLVYEFKKEDAVDVVRMLGILHFKGLKCEIEETEKTVKIIVPEER